MYHKSILLLILAQAVLSVPYTEQPCDENTQTMYNSKCVANSCFDDYNRRFLTVAQQGTYTNSIPITFLQNVQFTTDGNLEVQLQFTDKVKADGTMNKDNTNSCIESELWRFKSISYDDGVQDLSTIVSTYDSTNSYRVWTFTIKGQDLQTNLVIDTSDPENKYLEYNGYFGYRFKIVDTVQVFYNFNFVVKIEKSTKKVISTDYSSLTQNSKLTCDETNASNCITKADSSLKFCKSPDNCSDLSDTIGLFLNQNFAVKQMITTSGFTNYYLNLKGVKITGTGLLRKVTPVSFNNSVAGQLEVVIPVEFVYSAVTITIDSELINKLGRRVLTQSQRLLADSGSVLEGAHATVESSVIACIKTSESATSCPTCSEQQKYGATDPICAGQLETDTTSGNIISLALGILIMGMMI